MFQCFKCDGRGWVLDGGIEDGCLTGRETCPKCKGARLLSAEEVLAGVRHILQASVPRPFLELRTRVKTTKPNLERRREWTDEGWAKRVWGVWGIVIAHHDAHGPYYVVQHKDGSMACYHPSELEVVG